MARIGLNLNQIAPLVAIEHELEAFKVRSRRSDG